MGFLPLIAQLDSPVVAEPGQGSFHDVNHPSESAAMRPPWCSQHRNEVPGRGLCSRYRIRSMTSPTGIHMIPQASIEARLSLPIVVCGIFRRLFMRYPRRRSVGYGTPTDRRFISFGEKSLTD